MIKGVGIDIVENERIAELLKSTGDNFLKKILTTREIRLWKEQGKNLNRLCGTFAAKEAVIKAVSPQKLNFTDIEIKHPNNQSAVVISPKLNISLSISHENSYSIAVAILNS